MCKGYIIFFVVIFSCGLAGLNSVKAQNKAVEIRVGKSLHKGEIGFDNNILLIHPIKIKSFSRTVSLFKSLALCSSLGTSENDEVEYIVYDEKTGQITVSKAMIIIFGFLMIGLFFGATYFLKGNRQRHLEYEKNLWQALIDNIPDTIYFKDLESKFTRINKAQAKLLGLKDPNEAIGKTDFDFFKHAQEAYDVEQEIIRTRKPVINQLHRIVRDGTVKYMTDTKIPLIDKKNRCIGTVGITRDITDIKITEEAMLESQAKFKALFENAPLAIFRLDKDMRVVEYNYRFMKMFGYSKDDDLAKITKFDLLVDPELGSLILETIMETKEVNTEIMMKRKNGDEFIANLTLALLEEGFRETTIEGIVEDITQVAKAREELIAAKDKAVEADKLKSLFLANMSHEIRTPMNAIIGFTNMLREESLAFEEKNTYIDVIQSNGNTLMTLIDSIVDFSKLEADQMSISKGEFNFEPLFDAVCDHAEKIIVSENKRNIKLIKSKPNNTKVRLISDRHRLNQVLNHLVSNAVKFTNDGEIEIGYIVNENILEVFVRDTGIGIPKNKIGSIFERFTKVNNDKNRLYGGTGIGLTISKGLMELMGGEILVQSKEGSGSTFTLKMEIANGFSTS
ncbi:MAG: PAS domain S-box protein [Prolixibacteraceae bacterium]|nr:PAS domain S-box protein [Prolixibacteraceae bacterium]